MGNEQDIDKGNWIRLDKRLVALLPKDRPYTVIEALISMTIDINNGNKGTINGYASLWRWSRNKTIRFVQELRTGKDHMVGKKGTGNGHPIRLIDKSLEVVQDIYRTGNDQVVDSKRDTTNKTKKKIKKKKQPEAELDSFKEGISDEMKVEIAEKICILKEEAQDKDFDPMTYVGKCQRSGDTPELVWQILDELIKYASTTENLWGYAEAIRNREKRYL